MHDQLKSLFLTPAARFRPWPFLVFNEEHEGSLGEERITEMLEGFKRVGFGGAYIHPRPGLITEYLSPRWFELVRHVIGECRRLGLVPCLYDENSYPSGFAGGHALAEAPDLRSRHVVPEVGTGPETLPQGALAIFRWNREAPGASLNRNEVGKKTAWLAFVLRDFENVPFHAESSYVSLLDPRTVEVFLKTTHERYRTELGKAEWEALGSIFTDEPHLPGSTHGPWSEGLHCTPYVLAQFEDRYGYDLRPRLADLFFDTAGCAAVRHDFYDLLHQLWMQNWALPLEAWCRNNKIPLTGHYLEHDWPAPYATPGQMHILAHQDWPGTDFLECFELLGHDFDDPQGFDPAQPGQEPHALYYLKQALSVANQFRKERVMNESWGAGGHDSTPADWARIGRYLAVHGVNQFVPHHSFQTLRGTRKQDHPQFFSDQSPWFEYLTPLNDELARLSQTATLGQPHNRILFLDALTTGYCRARKADAFAGAKKNAGEDPLNVNDSLASFRTLRREIETLAQTMSDQLFDFDIGDEYILEESGSVRGGKLRVGRQNYDVVIWPPQMTNLRNATVPLLEAYLAGGGRLLGVRPKTITVDGRRSNLLSRWKKEYPEAILWVSNVKKLLAELPHMVAPRIAFERSPSTGLAHLYRRLPGGEEVFILVNSHPKETLDAPPRFTRAPRAVSVFDPTTGAEQRLEPDANLTIPPTEARIVWCGKKAQPGSEREKTPPVHDLPLIEPELIGIERVDPNVLVIDLCRLELRGKSGPLESVYLTNQRYWTAHGIATNGWFGRVQLRDGVLARDKHFPKNSGGLVRYLAIIRKPTDLSGIRLGVECPDLWKIAVNGKKVSFARAVRWRDPRLLAVEVGKLLRHGENEITLEARPFQVRQEIDAVYLLGDFSVKPGKAGFVVAGPSEPLRPGSWREQGLPFYDGAIDYRFRIPAGARAGLFVLPQDRWAGAAVELRHGEQTEIAYGPDLRFAIDPARGDIFTLRIIGLSKNLWGPWHIAAKPRKRAWSIYWRHDALSIDTPRPGKNYDLLDLGLLGLPQSRR